MLLQKHITWWHQDPFPGKLRPRDRRHPLKSENNRKPSFSFYCSRCCSSLSLSLSLSVSLSPSLSLSLYCFLNIPWCFLGPPAPLQKHMRGAELCRKVSHPPKHTSDVVTSQGPSTCVNTSYLWSSCSSDKHGEENTNAARTWVYIHTHTNNLSVRPGPGPRSSTCMSHASFEVCVPSLANCLRTRTGAFVRYAAKHVVPLTDQQTTRMHAGRWGREGGCNMQGNLRGSSTHTLEVVPRTDVSGISCYIIVCEFQGLFFFSVFCFRVLSCFRVFVSGSLFSFDSHLQVGRVCVSVPGFLLQCDFLVQGGCFFKNTEI